jgi:hypothetical protein
MRKKPQDTECIAAAFGLERDLGLVGVAVVVYIDSSGGVPLGADADGVGLK